MSHMINFADLNQAMMSRHQLAQGHQNVYVANNHPPVTADEASHVQQKPQQHAHKKANKVQKAKANKNGVRGPKRAATSYSKFIHRYCEQLKKDGSPVQNLAELSKQCAAIWATMSEDEKEPFKEAHFIDLERYKRELGVNQPATRDKSKPKRPCNAFILFMTDLHKKMADQEPEGGLASMSKLGSQLWKNMTKEDKKPYIEKQKAELEKYNSLMDDYLRKVKQEMASQAGSGFAVKNEQPNSLNAQQPQQQTAAQQIRLEPETNDMAPDFDAIDLEISQFYGN